MAHPDNPYDVGPRRGNQGRRSSTCSCCDLRFTIRSWHSNAGRDTCDRCVDHTKMVNEPREREVSRLSSHLEWISAELQQVRAAKVEAEKAYNDLQTRIRRSSAQNSRNSRALAALREDHVLGYGGACRCGARGCQVMQVIRMTDADVDGASTA